MKEAAALSLVVATKGAGGAEISGGFRSIEPDVSWALIGDYQGRAFDRPVAITVLIFGAAMTLHLNPAVIRATLPLLLFALRISTVGFF